MVLNSFEGEKMLTLPTVEKQSKIILFLHSRVGTGTSTIQHFAYPVGTALSIRR